jgi:hypothetical protein
MSWANTNFPECIVKSFPHVGAEKITRKRALGLKSMQAKTRHNLFLADSFQPSYDS